MQIQTKLGNTIELIGTPGDNNVLIIGVFHGDEPQGKFLIEKYLASPSPQPSPSRGEGVHHSYTQTALKNAKLLRKNQTDAEKQLWQTLRRKSFDGLKFRRQQPIGSYIADFVCFSKKLIIELDGGQHNDENKKEYDLARTKYLESAGFKVLRIWNDEIFNNIDGVIKQIELSLAPGGRGAGRGGNNLLFIPCLNPDGMALGKRTNANNVDLNRNFPTKNWGQNKGENATCDDETTSYYGGKSPSSEIETQFVINIIEKYKPKLILTLHAPYKVVNYDGPAENIAKQISKITGYPVEASIGYPTPGSFGTYCGVERNIPTITLELDEECPVEELSVPVFKVFDLLQT